MKEYKCRFCGKLTLSASGNGIHERYCKLNPCHNQNTYIVYSKTINDKEYIKHINPNDKVNISLLEENGCKRGYDKKLRFKDVNYKTLLNKHCYTNGIINKYFSDEYDNIPNDFYLGYTPNHKSSGKALTDDKEIERRNKISKTMKEKHCGGYRIGSGYGKKGWYVQKNGCNKGERIFCDPTWELAFVIYCNEHNIPIRRNTIKYNYKYNGEIHYYLPDFIINDKDIIEIKGYKDDKAIIKENIFKDIKVIDKYKISKYLNYCSNKYNKIKKL